jgi:hypothetical protein
MLRELQTVIGKNVAANYKAATAMVTGMGVVKDTANGKFAFASTPTATNVFFLNKERVPTGINTAKTDMSDYDTNFTALVENEFGKLVTPVVGEVYGTDQYVSAGLSVDNALMVGTDGKWKKATAQMTSRFQYKGTVVDNGRTLAKIEVLADTIANS